MRIRLVRTEDAPELLRIYSPFVRETWISFEYEPPSVPELEGRIRAVTAASPWLVAVEGDEVIGYAYADKLRSRPAYQWAQETTVYVDRGSHRRGVARALYGVLFAALRVQGFASAWAGIALPNPTSVAVHEALGFRSAGVWPSVGFKLGAWRDLGWWRLELQPLGAGAPPPRPLPAAAATAAWRDAGLPDPEGPR
ncbi:MAG TPA: GNAT family N-acetyltransferase [Vicinamibacteria bacterium]